ncbi:NAD(P)/FAD-dependent oxidoreductase [Erythrobacteraceae bacterium CFH 75059]|uniref:flavin-containing monooxygenase n=1 Tax=Qipengyuania thermophila TaxID=2509361 RepID=UPI0010200D0E|nr:NAD(P)/FAD-dependent oxidoreductase [Qipengyuania thermophila]TCD04818.1 NAD(P)/FAD-dependent oxidoreductase [Erythrobacteraceae bacterium CFH 75059]
MASGDVDVDVLIVGAGLSGIGMAAHMQDKCPGRSFAIVERRAEIGGTWDLFRYPGVRSDSDMHTLGYEFAPWRHEKSIADGDAILEYLHRIVAERDLARHIRFNTTVIRADWSHANARWTVDIKDGDGPARQVTARWLYLGAGYYDYDTPYDPGFDLSAFRGRVVHPQFWPADLDYTGKRVVVIGSGATAVTIVPAMARDAAHVTMLQRTPTWMFGRPAKDRLANLLRRILPERLAYRLTRWKNIVMQDLGFKRARTRPDKVAKLMHDRIARALGPQFDRAAFTPPYNPWEQRVCLVPDDDFFAAIRDGRASIVTDTIAGFEAEGVRLASGTLLPADIIVTATGLSLAVAGKIAISLDGEPVTFSDHFYYKGCMFSNVPNLAVVFGYLNASWTLRADLNADFVCRVLNTMAEKGALVAVPRLPAEHGLTVENVFDFSSGYLQRALHLMPQSAKTWPWRLSQDYRRDRRMMQQPVEDGILDFGRSPGQALSDARAGADRAEAAAA